MSPSSLAFPPYSTTWYRYSVFLNLVPQPRRAPRSTFHLQSVEGASKAASKAGLTIHQYELLIVLIIGACGRSGEFQWRSASLSQNGSVFCVFTTADSLCTAK